MRRLASFLVLLLLVSPAYSQGKKGVQTRTYLFKEADKDMEYAVFVPSKYDKEKKSPLMKKLDMTHEYIEVADGGHVDVAFQNLPRMFEFFEKHRRKASK